MQARFVSVYEESFFFDANVSAAPAMLKLSSIMRTQGSVPEFLLFRVHSEVHQRFVFVGTDACQRCNRSRRRIRREAALDGLALLSSFLTLQPQEIDATAHIRRGPHTRCILGESALKAHTPWRYAQ
jgi:hypothetical protein